MSLWLTYLTPDLGLCVHIAPEALTELGLRLVLLQYLAGDNQSLDLAGALVDLGDASVAVVPLCGHVRHVTHPSQNLDRLI